MYYIDIDCSVNDWPRGGNRKFCSSKTLDVAIDFATFRWPSRVLGKQNSLFPSGPVIKCFVFISLNSKIKTNCEKNICLMLAGTQIGYSFKEHDLITCK